MKALVVGGTGPTGPFIVNGLIERGYQVTILHRGTHEIDEIPPEVEHIHVDPHFLETLQPALEGRSFDLCVASYGRLRHVAAAMVGKTPRLIAIGGMAYRGFINPSRNFPRGEVVPVPEDSPLAERVAGGEGPDKMGPLVVEAEKVTLDLHPNATVLRYPYVYGPHQPFSREWNIVRRLRDERPYMLVPDGGRYLFHHGYAENMAHSVLLCVDNPDVSSGQIYNCGDDKQLTLLQIIEIISAALRRDIEIISVPGQVGILTRPLYMMPHCEHNILDTFKIRSELGYKDVISPIEGFARSCQWLMDHPPEHGGTFEQNSGDKFNYQAEDRFVQIYRQCLSQLSEFEWKEVLIQHPYPHPKTPGARDQRGR